MGRSLANILPLPGKSLYESRSADMQIHSGRIMAVRAAYRVHDLSAERAPLAFVELRHPDLLHHPRHIGALAGPAGTRLDIALPVNTRRSCTQSSPHVLYGVHMAAG